jgi:hypothetical protein
VIVTGYDDRTGCGYVMATGADAAGSAPGTQAVGDGTTIVKATPELAAALRDALANRPFALLGWGGPEVPLTLDDHTVLAWLHHTVGGVLTVSGGPGPDPRLAR